MPVPKVVALFQWLRGKQGANSPALSDITFTSESLEEAIKQSTLNKKKHFTRIDGLKKRGQPLAENDLELVWFDTENDYDELGHFVTFLRAQQHRQPLQVTLTYLLQHPEIAVNSIESFNTLFAAWFESNPVDAIAWYEDEEIQEQLLKFHPKVHLTLGKLVVERYTQEARALFQSVANPMGLIPLFVEYYDNPQQTAAFILCFLERASTAEEFQEIAEKIIQSGLLHDFFLFHSGFIGDDNNPITQLYRLLSAFPEAKPLVETASRISVMTKAEASVDAARRVSNTRAFASYALDGTFKREGLQTINPRPIAYDVVPEPGYFRQFHRLFGQRFLCNLLDYYRTSRHAGAKEVLEHQLNLLDSDGIKSQDLVKLLNVLARDKNESLLRTVSEFLRDTTVDTLLDSGSFSVFHLIPFNPSLLNKLNILQVQRVIESISPDDDQFNQLILLRTMLRVLRIRPGAEDVTALIFNKIIGVLMNSPELDDAYLVQSLRADAASPKCNEVLQQQAARLSEQLNQWVQAAITSEQGLTRENFQVLEDEWLSSSRKLTFLKKISKDVVCDLPHDKYAFYISLVKALLHHQGTQFNLQDTFSCLFPVAEEGLSQHVPVDAVSEQERTLIDLLLSTDNEAVYSQAIQLLEAPPVSRINWMERDYGGHTIIDLATLQGNNALIQYLRKESKLPKAANSRLLKIAATKAQWDTVKELLHLNGDNKPDVESVSVALAAATKADKLEWLLDHRAPSPGLFQAAQSSLELPVEPASLMALLSAHGEQETIKKLIKLSPELLKSLVTRANITDYSDRTFPNISAFEYALWGRDWYMWTMMLDALNEAFNEGYKEAETIRQEMLSQYNEVVHTHGVDYTLNGEEIHGEHHFDLQPLINTLDTYAKEFNGWKPADREREQYWCRIVGGEQRKLPHPIAGEYCRDKRFDARRTFNDVERPPSPVFYNVLTELNESWFPLSRLGVDLAIFGAPVERDGGSVAGGAAMGRRDGFVGLAVDNSAALSALCKVGAQNVEVLNERLSTPLQKRDLDESDRLSL